MSEALEFGANDKETLINVVDAVSKIRKELNYILYHLDDENIPELAQIKGDIEGNHTAIIQTEQSITLLASSVSGQSAQIEVLAGSISSKVGYGDVISSINQSAESITISASKISLNGITELNGLTKVKETLTLGSLTSDGYLVIRNQMSIYSSGSSMKIITPSGGAVDVLTEPGYFTYNGYEVATKNWVQTSGLVAKFG